MRGQIPQPETSTTPSAMENVKLLFRRRKPPEGLGAAASMTLTALKEFSDAFPPLNGAVRAVAHIRNLRLVRIYVHLP